ncbi:hypothetical protein WN55_03102 [Dufourea novaeangliae]|uniref:Transposable element Tc3 transposase n=1 Tax=Dufourea novaeangliae TaxID=178035 RepID=A0A154PI04_DUFNO|nr:hypothetical protein WN55_03102 [Dufourea novaeangliae]
MWSQHDGCPAHYSLIAWRELHEKFQNRWIGLGDGPISWPAHSSDLTPLDFFLWGTLQDKVYKEVANTRQAVQQRIIAACVSISSDVIRVARQSVIKRIQCCIDSDGHYFEYLL